MSNSCVFPQIVSHTTIDYNRILDLGTKSYKTEQT